jgi:phosphate transport system protein
MTGGRRRFTVSLPDFGQAGPEPIYPGDMREAYQIRLNDLGDHGAQMCQVASDALRDATNALLTADLQLAEKVIATDVQLDEMRANAETVALDILALQAPVASDLRAVISALWIVADLQRMGALAMHVAKAARRRHPAPVVPVEVRPIFERMGRVGVHLADQATQLLRERDVVLARAIETEDDLMDDLHQEMFAALLSPDWAHGVGPAVDLSLLGRFYERFADHAVSVARRVVFLVTGENVGGDTTPAALTSPER